MPLTGITFEKIVELALTLHVNSVRKQRFCLIRQLVNVNMRLKENGRTVLLIYDEEIVLGAQNIAVCLLDRKSVV